MINGIIGEKVGMTHVFVDGKEIPVTVVKAGECFVTQKKTVETDGYEAVQVGYKEKKESRVNKALQGHFKKAGTKNFYEVAEFKTNKIDEVELGAKVSCSDIFETGDFVDVSGKTKGKGFAGVMKRHGFKGGPGGHGSRHGRAGGAIGQCADPSRVFKNVKMAGQMGNTKITTQNLEIVEIDTEDNIMLIKGALPGAINGKVIIKKALKKQKKA